MELYVAVGEDKNEHAAMALSARDTKLRRGLIFVILIFVILILILLDSAVNVGDKDEAYAS